MSRPDDSSIPLSLRSWRLARPTHRRVAMTPRGEVLLTERGLGACNCRTANVAVFLVASGSVPWTDAPVAGSRSSRDRRGERA